MGNSIAPRTVKKPVSLTSPPKTSRIPLILASIAVLVSWATITVGAPVIVPPLQYALTAIELQLGLDVALGPPEGATAEDD